MTKEFFATQMNRLKLRFGERAFDPEFQSLIAKEVSNMLEREFTRLVEIMIGTRKHTHSPTLVDFREMRLQIEKDSFIREVAGAAKAFDMAASGSLKRFLEKDYPGCRTLSDALEVARFQLRVQRELNKPDGGGAA